MFRMWGWLGRSKDQIAIIFALIGALVFLFEYLDRQYEARIEHSLQNHRELSTNEMLGDLVDMEKKWISYPHSAEFSKHPKLDSELLAYIAAHGFEDRNYLSSFLRAHTKFRASLWCPLIGLCDWHTSCRLARSDMKPFYEHHKGMYLNWKDIRYVDYRKIFDEYIAICETTDVIYSRVDESIRCRASVYVRGFLNLRPGSACRKP
jgi:hypothetical protein